MSTQFTRSRNDKMIAGVCGGLARYFDVDPVVVRLVFVLSVVFAGVTPLIYLVLWLIMPEEPAATTVTTVTAAYTLPNHPRPVEEWKFDPYTGEPVRK